MMMSLLIDVWDKRGIVTTSVNGVYLHAKINNFTVLTFSYKAVNILCKMNNAYLKFVCLEIGKKLMYIWLLKALYGCVKSALLWYEIFTTTLQNLGFKLNPYDKCAANKVIDGKQFTISWHVDDNKYHMLTRRWSIR